MSDKLIIGIAGRKVSGKTTFANQVIVEHLNGSRPMRWPWGVDKLGRLIHRDEIVDPRNVSASVKVISFADPIKRFCIDVLGLTVQQCYGGEASKNLPTDICFPNTDKPMTAREVVQFFGTDIMRNWIPNVWLAAGLRRIQNSQTELVLVPDCRFCNELDALYAVEAKLVRLLRAPARDDHASENDLDDYPVERFDLVVPADLDGVAAQGEFILPTVREWLAELKEDR